jgi:hypothetical protein
MRSALVLALATALAVPAPSGSDPSEGTSSADRVAPDHQDAIDRGLAWLAKQQLPSGAFPTTPGAERGNPKSADYRTAVTALATLAFVGAGHGIRHGPYRAKVRLAVSWLLDAQDSEGYISFTGDDQSKMHGHGYATLALAEAYASAAPAEAAGEGPRSEEDREVEELSRRLHKGIRRAVELIERAQSSTGGWGYTPSSGSTTDHEGSVTVCQVQALQAASNRGIPVSL